MNDYKLVFDEYCWRGKELTAPEKSGIYCAYSCVKRDKKLLVDELLYIGQAGNLHKRLTQHTQQGDFNPELKDEKVVFYTWAELDGRSLDACEAAMIYHYQPKYNNQHKERFTGHDTTHVICSGKWAFRVKGEFTQEPTE